MSEGSEKDKMGATDTIDYDKLSKQDLIRMVKTKDVELNHLRKSLEKQSFDPSIFLNTKIRDLFWDKVRTSEHFSAERMELMSKMQTEVQKSLKTIGEREKEILALEEERSRYSDLKSLNDQHALVDIPADSPLAVGDMISCGISHPCTTFDRWQLLSLVDDEYNVVGGVRTFF